MWYSGSGGRRHGRLGLLVVALLGGLALAALAASAPPAQTRATPEVFPPVKGAKLRLECISPGRRFNAGEPAILTFRLKNLGSKRIVVYEWYMKEEDNLTIKFAPSSGEPTAASDQVDWLTSRPATAVADRRMPLELAPGNAVLIRRELPFVRDLDPQAMTGPVEYLLYGELNLQSLSARSQVIAVTVQPGPAEAAAK